MDGRIENRDEPDELSRDAKRLCRVLELHVDGTANGEFS